MEPSMPLRSSFTTASGSGALLRCCCLCNCVIVWLCTGCVVVCTRKHVESHGSLACMKSMCNNSAWTTTVHAEDDILLAFLVACCTLFLLAGPVLFRIARGGLGGCGSIGGLGGCCCILMMVIRHNGVDANIVLCHKPSQAKYLNIVSGNLAPPPEGSNTSHGNGNQPDAL